MAQSQKARPRPRRQLCWRLLLSVIRRHHSTPALGSQIPRVMYSFRGICLSLHALPCAIILITRSLRRVLLPHLAANTATTLRATRALPLPIRQAARYRMPRQHIIIISKSQREQTFICSRRTSRRAAALTLAEDIFSRLQVSQM